MTLPQRRCISEEKGKNWMSRKLNSRATKVLDQFSCNSLSRSGVAAPPLWESDPTTVKGPTVRSSVFVTNPIQIQKREPKLSARALPLPNPEPVLGLKTWRGVQVITPHCLPNTNPHLLIPAFLKPTPLAPPPSPANALSQVPPTTPQPLVVGSPRKNSFPSYL